MSYWKKRINAEATSNLNYNSHENQGKYTARQYRYVERNIFKKWDHFCRNGFIF